MRKHIHHIIPKSRGGTDEEWNLVSEDAYDHAYNHALDFVLFDSAPWFDHRHESYSLLPKDLKEAISKECSKRATERNLLMVSLGQHPMQQKHNRDATSIRSREWCESQLANGTHVFMGETASKARSEENQRRVSGGTHNFLGEGAGKRASDFQLRRVEEGTHQWKTEEHSRNVSARFKGAKHWVNEKGDRKFQIEKPKGEWQNGRIWRNK
jgi:hypothetical protein